LSREPPRVCLEGANRYGKLFNVVIDMHGLGPMIFGEPLVVIDCYEVEKRIKTLK
jgi:hypothetical protein